MAKKILIVDDEYYITRSLSFLFQKEGYHCRVAYDGQAAIEQIKSDKPDLMFLDVDMPRKNGFEVAREIRGLPDFQDIYIIMLTAKGQEVDRKEGVAAGVDEFILKPFDPRATLKRVQEILK